MTMKNCRLMPGGVRIVPLQIRKVWDVFWDTSRIEEEVRDKEGRSV